MNSPNHQRRNQSQIGRQRMWRAGSTDSTRVFVPGDDFMRKNLHGQLQQLFKAVGVESLNSKPKVVGAALQRARLHTIQEFLQELHWLGRKFKNLTWISPKFIALVVSSWLQRGFAASTLRSRMSHLNWLLAVLDKPERVQPKLLLSEIQLPPQQVQQVANPIPSQNSELHLRIEAALKAASQLDRFAGMQLKLVYHIKIAPREAIGFQPNWAFIPDQQYLFVESETRSIKPRKVGPLNAQQVALIREAQELVKPFKNDRLRLPERTPAEARARFYYIARKVGFSQDGLGITPDELFKLPPP